MSSKEIRQPSPNNPSGQNNAPPPLNPSTLAANQGTFTIPAASVSPRSSPNQHSPSSTGSLSLSHTSSTDSLNEQPKYKRESHTHVLEDLVPSSNLSDHPPIEEVNIFQAILLQQEEVLEQLLDTSKKEYIVYLKSTDSIGRTPLHLACSRGDIKTVKLILATAAANVETADRNGWSPLCVAAFHGHKEIVSRLLEESADVDIRESTFDWTPMLASVWNGYLEVFELLVDQGSSLQMKDRNGRNALFLAAQRNHVAILDYILKKDSANTINEVDNHGRTPLYVAVQLRHKEAVQKLCAVKANLELADADGRKPLFMAYKLGYEEIAEVLVSAGANQDALEVDLSQGSGEEVRPCRGKFITYLDVPVGNKVTCICEAGDKIWAGCSDGSIIIWDAYSRKRLLHYSKAQSKTIHHMCATDLNTVWCLSGNMDIYIWNWIGGNITSAEPSSLLTNSLKLTQSTDINAIIRFGTEIYAGSSMSTIFIWNTLIPSTCRKLQLDTSSIKLHDYEAFVSGLYISNDRLFVSIHKYIFCYDINAKFAFKGHFEGHNDGITALLIIDKHLWTASRDNTIRVWNVDSRECIKVFSEAGGGQVTCLARTKDDQILSAGRDGLVRSWDTKALTWKRTFPAKHQKIHISAMHFDSFNRLWVSSLDKTVSYWR